jgi:hypothetical protein
MTRLALLLPLALLLAGCADRVSFAVAGTIAPVGFLYGLWHGTILPFAWLVSLFDRHVTIYAIYNNGAWYNTGFLLGASGIFGGGVASLR